MSNEWFEVARGAFFILWMAGVPALFVLSVFLGAKDYHCQDSTPHLPTHNDKDRGAA
jgi:hypothetical protein